MFKVVLVGFCHFKSTFGHFRLGLYVGCCTAWLSLFGVCPYLTVGIATRPGFVGMKVCVFSCLTKILSCIGKQLPTLTNPHAYQISNCKVEYFAYRSNNLEAKSSLDKQMSGEMGWLSRLVPAVLV